MKKISLISALLFTTVIASAQSPTSKIVLAKEQQLKFVTTTKATISQEMMGQSMETIMNMDNSKTISIKDIVGQDYLLDATMTRIKMNMSLMGQDKMFDSDNKDDMNGELKEIGKDINKPVALSLSTDGKCKAIEKASPEKPAEENPMNGMMQQMLGGAVEEISTQSYFMLIPPGKKVGDTWEENTASTKWNFVWESTKDNIAMIKATGKETTASTMNMMGMDMVVNMTNDITESRKLNIATGVITENTSTKKVSGTIEVMGQNIPVTGTTSTTTMMQ